jgi:hypothetical protein
MLHEYPQNLCCIYCNNLIAGKKPRTKAPKIQRLVTPITLQRKRRRISLKNKRRQKRREESALYHQTLAKYAKVHYYEIKKYTNLSN